MKPQGPGESDGREEVPAVTREVAAEAAVWVARLHGPDRSPRMERECLEWQARSSMHRHAFEKCTDTWEQVAHISVADAFRGADGRGDAVGWMARPNLAKRRSAMTLATVALLGGSAFLYWREAGSYSTDVGEQQSVVLGDGTRMSLNTRSRVRVDLGSTQRRVDVERGEALFEVAKDASRSFIVRAGGSEVLAIGTVFSVKLQGAQGQLDDSLEVTLMEGKVTVRAAGERGSALAPSGPLSLAPGDRLRLARASGTGDRAIAARVDRPQMEGIVAWKRNEAVFEDVSLADAVAELNRYNRTPIVLIGGPSLAKLRVSGSFRTGDAAGFAQSVAALHHLTVREHGGRLELTLPQ